MIIVHGYRLVAIFKYLLTIFSHSIRVYIQKEKIRQNFLSDLLPENVYFQKIVVCLTAIKQKDACAKTKL